MELRNVAIIAHVDHGKTTLVDGLLKQSHTFRANEAAMSQTLLLDSNDQERERGITILAKNTAITYGGVKINIIDTPGHADFSGEVERTLNMADGALLIIDAQEGPMPQTKFVLKKALELGLKVIVVINKIDKRDARTAAAIEETADLFLDLATHESQLDYPIYYAISRDGKAWEELPETPEAPGDLTPLFEGILKHIPPPTVDPEGPFQLLVAALDWDPYQGRYAIGRISRGTLRQGQALVLVTGDGTVSGARAEKVYVSHGLKRLEVEEAECGDVVAIVGARNAGIGETLADPGYPEALPTITIGEPTLKIAVSPNISPFAGREGQFLTGRQILDRIKQELETNVSMRLEIGDAGEFVLSGRGELHLSVFVETLRREGFEIQVGKPQVITKVVGNTLMEPLEELTIDVGSEYAGPVTAEVGRRKGVLVAQSQNNDGSARMVFEVTTRGILGLRNELLTLSRGTAVMNSLFLRFEPFGAPIPRLRNGVLVASEGGKAVTFGLNIAQGRGVTFIEPSTEVYEGQIIGLNSRDNDIVINVCKQKKMTNVRSSTSDIAVILSPPVLMSLEQCLDFLEDDELLEVAPKSLRLRKKVLDAGERAKSNRPAERAATAV
ncbi:MAG: translational GTPase TypA [Chloroflexota bacterium]